MPRIQTFALTSTRTLVLLTLSVTLAACSAQNTEAESTDDSPSASASVSSSAAATETAEASTSASSASADAGESGETPTEETQGAAGDSQARDVALDSQEVEQAQTLVQDVQQVLSSAEADPASTASTVDEAEGSPNDEIVNPSIDLSASTVEKINTTTTDAAAEDFQATALEYLQNNWKVEGQPTFVGDPKITDTTYKGQTAKRLEVCVDSSAVKVTDEAGNSVLAEDAPTRSLTYYTLVDTDGSWKIASVDFPDNPDC